jgi:4a-hydroxytetrahydrobiopterin dehydratase
VSPPEIPTCSVEEIRRRLAADLPGWSYDRGWLRRDVPMHSRARALLLASRLAYLAEAARHHPDLEIEPDVLRIRVRHHWAAGVTESDFQLARAVEEVLAALPPDPAAR